MTFAILYGLDAINGIKSNNNSNSNLTNTNSNYIANANLNGLSSSNDVKIGANNQYSNAETSGKTYVSTISYDNNQIANTIPLQPVTTINSPPL